MDRINWAQKLRYMVFCRGMVLFFKEAKYFPRTFSDHYNPNELWYLWAAFIEKNDASDYRAEANRVGSYARCIKLPVPIKQALSSFQYAYKWGVWVPPTHISRLNEITCHWKGKQGGFEIYNPKEEEKN